MADKENGHDEGVKVTDHRRFETNGTTREGAEEAKCPQPDMGERLGAKPNEIPDIDFPTFVLSLATSAQVHLGVIANPATGKAEADMVLAKQTIDILGVLQDKTKGNLKDEEGRLLEHLLYDLRMIYVEKNKK